MNHSQQLEPFLEKWTELICTPKIKKISHIVNTLLKNDYPADLIFNTINIQLKVLIHKENNRLNQKIKLIEASWFVLSYMSKISDEFKRISNFFNIKLAFTSLNKLNCLIRVQKDPLLQKKKENVVHEILCRS